MKKLLSIMLAIILVFTLTACSDKGEKGGDNVLRVGLECNYAPFNWTQSKASDDSVPIPSGGHAGGYDVQIAKKIAEGLGRELVIVKTEWDGLTPAVNSGKIDAIIAGMSPTAERALEIDFTDAYYESDLVVVVKKDGQYADAKSLEDLTNSKITGQLNTFHYSVIDQIPNVQKQNALENFPAMIVALESGKIDGYVSERPGAVSAMSSNPNLTFITFDEGKGFEASPEDISIAVGLKKGSELKEQINKVLEKISKEERQKLMDDAIANQPLQE